MNIKQTEEFHPDTDDNSEYLMTVLEIVKYFNLISRNDDT